MDVQKQTRAKRNHSSQDVGFLAIAVVTRSSALRFASPTSGSNRSFLKSRPQSSHSQNSSRGGIRTVPSSSAAPERMAHSCACGADSQPTHPCQDCQHCHTALNSPPASACACLPHYELPLALAAAALAVHPPDRSPHPRTESGLPAQQRAPDACSAGLGTRP